MKHLSRIRPSGVIAFTALFIAMSGIAVADNDGTAKDNGKVNIGKGKIGFGEISKGAKKKLAGAQGAAGAPGPAGSPGSPGASGTGSSAGNAPTNSFTFRVDNPTSNTVILTGNGFQLRASCSGSGDLETFLDSTADNVAFSQAGMTAFEDQAFRGQTNDRANEGDGPDAGTDPDPEPFGGAPTDTDPVTADGPGDDLPNEVRNQRHDGDFDIADGDQELLDDGSQPEPSGSSGTNGDDQTINVLNVRPLTGAVTTVTYAVNEEEQGKACNVTGTSTTQG